MKPHELFGVVVRSIGLVILLAGLLYLYSAVAVAFAPDKGVDSPVSYFVAGFGALLVSIYFLRGAPLLVRFAYHGHNQ